MDNVESGFERLELRDDVIGVGAAGGADVSQPCRAFGITPWFEWRPNGEEVGSFAHLQGLSQRFTLIASKHVLFKAAADDLR